MFGGHEWKFWYVEEEPYGVTPQNPQFKGIEIVEDVNPQLDSGNIKLPGTGSRDLAAIKKGLRKVGFTVAYAVPSDDVMQFLQHALTLIPQTCEVIYEQVEALVVLRFTGCRFDKTTVECSEDDVLRATVELIGQNLAAENTKLAGATYTEFGGAIPYHQCYVSRGNANGDNQVVTEEVTDWKFNVNNNLKRVPVIRSSNGELLKYLLPLRRSLTGEVTFEFTHRNQYYDVLSDAEFSLKFGLGPKFALFKYCKWDTVGTPSRIEDLVYVKAAFTARQVEFEGVEA